MTGPVRGSQFEAVSVDGTTLRGEVSGSGRDIVLLHGLTASRRYVLMGSRLLEKEGWRVISFDARGHGRSDAAPSPVDYTYPHLVADLCAVVAQTGATRPVLMGISMGAHTAAAAYATGAVEASALLLVTPAFSSTEPIDPATLAHWERLSQALRTNGPEGFVDEWKGGGVADKWLDVVTRATLQRLRQHSNPEALSDALMGVPRSRPFEGWDTLNCLTLPTTVVGSLDSSDPGHPLETARQWSAAIPEADFVVEEEGESPIAWRGAFLSRLVTELV
ncbi:MAG: alpha/beta fold hydrolase [Solirubrobacterales bacterium]|nr:alpha/beta fold hydrolase [Solirubrobacterales bacterium]